jgi:copper(I)-binding protein
MRSSLSLFAVLTPLLLPIGAFAADSSGIAVDHAWARPTIGSSTTSAAYFTVTDTGAADRLISVTTPVASRAEVHESFSENGVMKMRAVPGVALDPGKPVHFAPGGYHVMLMGLKQPLKPGDSFPITLRFEHAPEMTVSVTVQQVAGPGHGMQMRHDMQMGHDMPHTGQDMIQGSGSGR